MDKDSELRLIEMMLKVLGMGKDGDEKGKFSFMFNHESISLSSRSISVSANQNQGTLRIPGQWVREVKASVFQSETENTTFTSAGIAKTADGRELTFNIDGDGKKENISKLGGGSGFLALDKNNDGVINDGMELFGAKTGDGFSELKAYDEDGNGWIDENDAVFKNLKIWTKDELDNDVLVAIGKAGLGAIYLGSVSTDFSLNSAENNAKNGQIRRTGFYLTEAGEARTVQHVDLAV